MGLLMAERERESVCVFGNNMAIYGCNDVERIWCCEEGKEYKRRRVF